MSWTHIGKHKLMYFFIILCLYSQVCIEFFLCVFGLVLVLQCLHSHARRPPVRHPPHHHLLGYQGAAFLQCALLVATTLCALLMWRHACPLPPHAPHAVSVPPVLSNRQACAYTHVDIHIYTVKSYSHGSLTVFYEIF